MDLGLDSRPSRLSSSSTAFPMARRHVTGCPFPAFVLAMTGYPTGAYREGHLRIYKKGSGTAR
ncbi:hypothetical protein LFML04_0872 [Leptospirillum ferriphilum ML-04]|uniref:Uncharacterized protein n=1 Tax=Leptospirillum ferriphilum (strain ML-04) TaxID=1048260 RepID=J9Z9D0_LEPFM|nr:hypothetical protein LFML04_0872 [Leptospirillum ferriphilum ML-04]